MFRGRTNAFGWEKRARLPCTNQHSTRPAPSPPNSPWRGVSAIGAAARLPAISLFTLLDPSTHHPRRNQSTDKSALNIGAAHLSFYIISGAQSQRLPARPIRIWSRKGSRQFSSVIISPRASFSIPSIKANATVPTRSRPRPMSRPVSCFFFFFFFFRRSRLRPQTNR